jgi:hypothetical protein
MRGFYLFGDGAAGVLCAGAVGAPFTFSMTEFECLLEAKMVREMEVSIKITAHQVVTLESRVAVPRGPNAVWLADPPKVAAISALLPCCRSTTRISTAHTMT